MKNRDILISGASIAGPALAYWLRRFGFNPTIVERAPAPRSGGQAIDLRGAARTVVARMGLLEQIYQAHTGTRGMSVVNSAGKTLVSMGSDVMDGSGGMIAEIEILRGDLVRILYETTRHDVEYLFDDSITSIAQDDEGAHVTFERSSPRRFDLVVGADGLHSHVRKLLCGDESRFTHDLGCNVAIFSAPNVYHLDGWELIYQMPGNRRVAGKSVGLYPVRGNSEVRAMFYFAMPPMPRTRYDRHDITAQKRLLAEAFAGEGWEIPRLLDALWQTPEFYMDRVAQIQMDRWSSGRVVLLGDAGYCPSPMSGMGTSLALVGAYVLAGELTTSAGNYPAAFASYQDALREAVKRAQAFANGGHRFLLPASRGQLRMTNQVMRLMTRKPFARLMSSGVEKAANAVTLKDYAASFSAAPARLG